MQAPDPVIKQQIQRRFDRASHIYRQHNQIQTAVMTDLLTLTGTGHHVLLDLGCGPGVGAAELQQRCQQYVATDISHAMLSQCPTSTLRIQADMDQLPFASASIDCIFSSLAMQWSHRPAQLLKEMVRITRPSAQIVLSAVVAGSLEPLNTLRQSLDGYPLANSQFDYAQWQALIEQTSDLQICKMQKKRYTLYAETLSDLLLSIKGVGAGARNNRPALNRPQLRQLELLYQRYRTETGLPLHYEVGLFNLKRQ